MVGSNQRVAGRWALKVQATQAHWEGISPSVNVNSWCNLGRFFLCPRRNLRTLHHFEWNGEVIERNRKFS
jgi:hypothetical protein